MYLAMLNESEKELFLGLAYYLSSVDGEYSDEEKQMMESYCHEMKMDFDLDNVNKSIDDVINKIQTECGKRAKKIIIFEAIGLAMIDGNYDEQEKNFIKDTMKLFDIEESFDKKCEDAIKEYIDYQNKLNEIVLG